MTDARRITVGPIAAAYLEIQQGTVLVPGTDYDALRAEAEALRAENGRLQADRDRANQYANQQALECNKLSTDLEAARGLLRHIHATLSQREMPYEYKVRDISSRIDALINGGEA